MATKLKNMRLTSVDLVKAGANQEADICLYKSADDPTEPPEYDDQSELYKSAITESIQSITADGTLSEEDRNAMIEKSLQQYHDAMVDLFGRVGQFPCDNVEKSESFTGPLGHDDINSSTKGMNSMIRIDKSIFTEDERAQYEALIAKAMVDPEAAQDEMEDDMDGEMEDDYEDMPPVRAKKKCSTKKKCGVKDPMAKSASPELAAAMQRLENLEKSIKMNEFTEIAKKYAPLGENVDELANTLYDMKESNEANYEAYIGILDKSLGLIAKSGLFTEIGKSTSGMVSGGVIDKIEAAATDIQKSNADMSREAAIAKAWENHPELVAEYDALYKA